MKNYDEIVDLVRNTLVDAGSTFRDDKKNAYKRAIAAEQNEKAKWVLEQILENADVAEKNKPRRESSPRDATSSCRAKWTTSWGN